MEIELSDYTPDINKLKTRVIYHYKVKYNLYKRKYNKLESIYIDDINLLKKKYKEMLNNEDDLARKIILGEDRIALEENFDQDIKTCKTENNEFGIPLYWQSVLLNCNRLKHLINFQDIKILSFLNGINIIESGENVII